MKLQKLSLIVGAIALSLTATTVAVKAQTISSSPLIVAQASEHHSFWQSLGLTDDQKAQIKQIRHNTRDQIKNILTPAQQDQLKTARQNHQGWRQAKDSLNLTDDQKNQIRQLIQSQKQQIDGVLTPEQKQQQQQHWKNRHSQDQEPNS
ncbi:MAG: P pilus assembly/Cpx signaling pathway, periplasmic inhibitor/zinc-resistance associated protein [Stigonema ocellatum SAG 48.90 = DSM 106950]|nr:P pilus assembly/Cpx signaling pathway, periplasmic inhibitor/zinc-resistance associated protein [Stigonema ocellatum SAG 48.90 = DSM 106950]